MKSYRELVLLPTIKERFDYLKLSGKIGLETFGGDRFLNQIFYRTPEWRKVRREVIVRDEGREFGLDGYDIGGRIIVHHMNPITVDDIEERNPDILNPDYLICVSELTHQAIHYGDESLLPKEPVERRKWDTAPWRHDR